MGACSAHVTLGAYARQLTPGATFIPRGQTAQYNGSEIRARKVNVTVNGQSYLFTGWSLDGANATNFEFGGTLVQPNVDAIQEFSVAAGNMSPEYGHTPIPLKRNQYGFALGGRIGREITSTRLHSGSRC